MTTAFKYARVALSSDDARAAVAMGRSSSRRINCREYSMTVASRFYFSNLYRILYVVTVVASAVCVAWTWWNNWRIPASVLFISLEIGVSALLVFEVLLRIVAFRSRFWSKWCNVFDFVALVMSLVSVAMYFNEEGVLGELEEVATDALLAFRNAIQYVRLAIFLKNRQEHIGGSQVEEIDFDSLPTDDIDDEEEATVLIAEMGLRDEDGDVDEDLHAKIAVV